MCVFCFVVFIDDWCLNLMFGYVVNGYVNMVCFCVAVFVDGWRLTWMLGYVVIGYVKLVCVCFVLPVLRVFGVCI